MDTFIVVTNKFILSLLSSQQHNLFILVHGWAHHTPFGYKNTNTSLKAAEWSGSDIVCNACNNLYLKQEKKERP